MRVHNCEQNTPEWELLRAGIPTASAFDRIITPTGKLSKQSRDYKAWLLAERVLHAPIATKKTAGMIRGTEFERQAVEFYEALKECRTERIGFVTNDAGTIGASPDCWCGDDGQWEIKVPEVQTHMGYLIAQNALERCEAEIEALRDSKLPAKLKPVETGYLTDLQARYDEAFKQCIAQEYKVQTMGQLWVTERRWSELLAYSPEGLPPVFQHLERDEGFIAILAQSVSEFSRDLEESAAELKRQGVISE